MASVTGYFAAVVLVSFLSRDLIVNGIPLSDHTIVRRTSIMVMDKNIAFVGSGFSNCTGTCGGSAPAGIRTRSVLCLDQDNIRHQVCSASVTENCCSPNSFIVIVEACNPDCSSSVTPVFPNGSFVTTNGDQSTTNVTISVNGAITTIVTVTAETDGGTTTVTDTREMLAGGGTRISVSFSFTNPPPTMFDVNTIVLAIFTTSTFRIDEVDILLIPQADNLVRRTVSNDTVEYVSSTATLSNVGVPVTITESAPIFYYISPLGIVYSFTGHKITREVGEGLFLVDQNNMVAIFSQYETASNLLQTNLANSYQIQTPSSTELLLRLNLAQDFFVNNITEIMTSGEPAVYSNGALVTSSTNTSAAILYIFGGMGFEVFDDDVGTLFEDFTFISSYDAIFYNSANRQILVSTSPLLSQQIRQGMSFLDDGNTLQDGIFMVDGNTITYQGIVVLQVTGSTRLFDFSSQTVIIHSENSLEFAGSTISDVTTVYTRQTNGLLASLSLSRFAYTINPGSIVCVDDTGRAVIIPTQFTDIINFFNTTRNAILNPVFPTAPPSATFTLERVQQQVFLRINSMNVLEATASNCQTFPITSAGTLTYNNGVIEIQTQGGTLNISGVGMLTVASNGQNVTLLQSTDTGYSISVDSTYFLRICNVKAVLTDNSSIQSLIQSAVSLPAVIVFNGQRSLFLGSTLVLPLNRQNIQMRVLNTGDSLRLRDMQLSIRLDLNLVDVISVINGLVIFAQTDSSPQVVDQTTQAGTLFIVDGDRAFLTDRSDILDIISSELGSAFTVQQNQAGQTTLREGGSDIIILNGVEEISVASGESLRFNPSTNLLEVVNSSNNVQRTFTGVNNVHTLLLGGPTTAQTLQSMTTINGPVRLYAQSRMGEYFVTDNPSVQSLASQNVQSQTVNVATSGSDILLIIGFNTFVVSSSREISGSERVEYSGSELRVRGGGTDLTLPNIDEYFVYLTSDFRPQNNTMQSAGSETGPGQLYYNMNQAFFTNRNDVVSVVSSIVPQPITTRMIAGGGVVLVIGGVDQIVLNARAMVPVVTGTFVRFTGSAVDIVSAIDSSVISTFNGINSFKSYLNGDTMPQVFTTSQLITDVPGRLVVTSDTAFYTNRDDVLSTLTTTRFDLITETAINNGNTVLLVGGEVIVRLSGSNRIDIMDDEEIMISGSTIVIRNIQTGVVRRTITNISNVFRYLSSDTTPQSNPGNVTISGPFTFVVNSAEGGVIITNRSEVINVISTILPRITTPTISFGIREDANGNMVLVIDMMDIITINNALIRSVSNAEEVTFSTNLVTVRSIISGMISGTPNGFSASRLIRYLTSDNETQTFNTSASSFNGPAIILYNRNEAPPTVFVTDRQNVSTLIIEAIDSLTVSATPAPVVTPEPPVTIDPPETVDIVNVDGSRWTTTDWSDCSRTCGVGVRVRNVRCVTAGGLTSATICDQQGQRTAYNIPPLIELCNIEDCPGGIARRGVPREESLTFTSSFGTSNTNSRVVVRIFDSNIENQMYTIEVVSADRRSGSFDRRRIESIAGLQTMSTDFSLRTEPKPMQSSITRVGLTLQINVDGEVVYFVNPVPRYSFPGDQCLEVADSVEISYRNRTLTVGSLSPFGDILVLISSETVSEGLDTTPFSFVSTFQEDLQSIDFGDLSDPRDPFTITGPAVVCVSQEMQSAFVGGITDTPFILEADTNFISTVVNQFNMLSDTLSAPVIAPFVSSPTDEITTSGEVIQIGTPSVEVREDIFYFSLRCELSNPGIPSSPVFTFTVDGEVIISNNVKYSISGNTLLIKNINEGDEGNYTCTVANAVGTDEETTEVLVNQRPVPMGPEVTPPTPTPPPSWVPEAFSECSVPECGVGIRARAVVCREANGQQSQDCVGTDVPALIELCNTNDCPGGPARNGAPPVNTTEFIRSIFNGDVRITVDVTSSDTSTGNYMVTVTARYPDETVIIQMLSNVGNTLTVTTSTTFGPELLFGRVEATLIGGHRIDIQYLKLLFSVIPQVGDQCFDVPEDEQFIYSENQIINRPNTFDNMLFLLGVENEGVMSFIRSSNRVFTGPLALCVSTAHARAFYTDIPALREMILSLYNEVLDTFEAPMIERVNDTTIVVDNPFSAIFVQVGEDIEAPEGSTIYIGVQLSDSGNPPTTEVTWMFNGEPLYEDPDKGIFFLFGRYTLIINHLTSKNVGQYTATVSNPAGSDSVTSSVILRPQEGILVSRRISSPPRFEVGIGTSHNIDSNMYSSLTLTCEVITNQTAADIRLLVNDVEATTGTPPGVVLALGAKLALLNQDPLVSGTTIFTCEAQVGNTTFTETSVVNVMAFSAPSKIDFTGRTQLNVGESSIITCTADGVPPSDTKFNEIRLGPQGIVSNFLFFANNSMKINKAVYRDDSQYCCEATNSEGNLTECIDITLMVPASITRPTELEVRFIPLPLGTVFPLDPIPRFSAMVGQNVTIPRTSVLTIRCEIVGSPIPLIRWFVNGVESMEAGIGENFTIDIAQPEDSGRYECRVSNAAGDDTLTTVVTVVAPPTIRPSTSNVPELSTNNAIVTIEQSSDLFVLDGLDFCLRCDFNPGIPSTTSVLWLRGNDRANIRDVCLSLAENGTVLCFDSITRPYSDEYNCKVSNIAGSDRGGINVIVAEPPRISFPNHHKVPPPGFCDSQLDIPFVSEDVGVGVCVSPGTRVLIDCEISGTPRPMATVQWIFNETGQVILNNVTGITIFTNNSLLIESVQEASGVGGSGTYVCRASNFAGMHSRATLIRASGDAPVIDISQVQIPFQGKRRVINVGSTRQQTVPLQHFTEIKVLCSTEGSPTPQISWTVNGVDITDESQLFEVADDGCLLITGLKDTECAQYTCTASNSIGQVSRSVTICGEIFNCLHNGYGECSATCGLGIRQATFECNRTFDGSSSPSNYFSLPYTIRPTLPPENCGETQEACPRRSYRYVTSEFSECSTSCGCGRQFRTVSCFIFIGEEPEREVSFKQCQFHAENQIPPLSQDCNTFPCPEWRAGDFTECSRECGFSGNQTREVICVAPANGNRTVEDSFCNENDRPVDYQRCNRRHCPYQYVADAWGPCSTTCEGGVRTRRVFCYNAEANQEIDYNLCVRELGEDKRLISTHICGTGLCLGQFAWSTGSYGPCSVTCGGGVHSRTVQCVRTIDHSVVSDSVCIANRKPPETIPCSQVACPGGEICVESSLCGIVVNLGMCSLFRDQCCSSCP